MELNSIYARLNVGKRMSFTWRISVTLVRTAFPQKPYVSLEDPDQREFAQDDPRRFLGRFGDGAVLD